MSRHALDKGNAITRNLENVSGSTSTALKYAFECLVYRRATSVLVVMKRVLSDFVTLIADDITQDTSSCLCG